MGTAKVTLGNITIEGFRFILLISNSVTIEIGFLLLSISATVSPNTINNLEEFYKHHPCNLSTQ